MHLLAVSEDARFWVPLVISILALLISVAVTIVLWRLGNIIRKYERMEDKGERDMAEVKKQLHDANVKLIDTRFREMTHELRNEMNALLGTAHETKEQLKQTAAETKERLKEVDGIADGLNERDQKIELTIAAKFDALKDYIRESCASKADVKDHERAVHQHLSSMSRDVVQLGKEVAVLGEQVKAAAGKRATER